jgi:SNF2 family DNA or RNA helicase
MLYYGANKKTITLEMLKAAPIVITSYNTLLLRKNDILTLLYQVYWGRVVFDEAHHLRNKKTYRVWSIMQLNARIRWLVSGTPVHNSLNDFNTLCSILRLPANFYKKYCNLPELNRTFVLKRTKVSVGILLPNLVIETKNVCWENEYEKNMSEIIHKSLRHAYKQERLTLMIRARQSCIYPKMLMGDYINLTKYLIDNASSVENIGTKFAEKSSKLDIVCNSILERKDNGCGKLIFCQFREEIDEISRRLMDGGLANVVAFDGRTSFMRRREILKTKQDAIILQIQTGCEGLNLQEDYSEVYFVCPHWNPAIEEQAIARCHRIGQSKPVYVMCFIMSDFIKDDEDEGDEEDEGEGEGDDEGEGDHAVPTMDNYIRSTQERKRDIANGCFNYLQWPASKSVGQSFDLQSLVLTHSSNCNP